MAADGKTPPTHPQGGGGGNIMCICSIFVCIHNKNDIPTLRAHVHTYIQTNHKSIETYSYTYTWLQMVRPPPNPPTGGGGNIMCICNIFVCIHNKNDMPTLLGHVHAYIQTNTINQYKQIVIIHKSIETYSYTYTWLQMVRPPQPTHRGGREHYVYMQ